MGGNNFNKDYEEGRRNMKGGFNKILRNIVAGSSDTEFEKRLTKATFQLDSKEPKEKHVICKCNFSGLPLYVA